MIPGAFISYLCLSKSCSALIPNHRERGAIPRLESLSYGRKCSRTEMPSIDDALREQRDLYFHIRGEVGCDGRESSVRAVSARCRRNETAGAYRKNFSTGRDLSRSAPARNAGLKTIVSLYPRPATPSSVRPLLL